MKAYIDELQGLLLEGASVYYDTNKSSLSLDQVMVYFGHMAALGAIDHAFNFKLQLALSSAWGTTQREVIVLE